jgi:hypothetical protein
MKGNLFVYTTNVSGRGGVYPHSFVTLELDKVEWSASYHSHFIPRKELQYLLNRRLVVPQNHSLCCGQDRISSPCWESSPGLSSL